MRRTIGLSFLTLMLFGFVDLTPEEIECEHAAAALEDCCPEVDFHRLTCVTDPTCGGEVDPAFDEETSLCLQSLSCDQMRAIGPDGRSLCARVDIALDEREAAYEAREGDEPLEAIEGVCP